MLVNHYASRTLIISCTKDYTYMIINLQRDCFKSIWQSRKGYLFLENFVLDKLYVPDLGPCLKHLNMFKTRS